eukprot:8845337-Prorocentrum_lima.AAC.1
MDSTPTWEELSDSTTPATFTTGMDGLLVGQQVSTPDGSSGRVMKVMMETVQLSFPDGITKTVRIDSLANFVVAAPQDRSDPLANMLSHLDTLLHGVS